MLIEVTPAIEPPAYPSRRLRVRLGDRMELDALASRTETFLIPVSRAEGETIDLMFRFSPAKLAGDARPLAFAFNRVALLEHPIAWQSRQSSMAPIGPLGDFARAVAAAEAVAGLAIGDLLGEFESLGQTCDFGFLQRRCGIEPLGLLRFAGIDLARLVRGLLDRSTASASPGLPS